MRLFCSVDDFLKMLEEERKKNQKIDEDSRLNQKRNSDDRANVSEISVPEFQIFLQIVFTTVQSEFPKIPSYKRFVALMSQILHFLTPLFDCTFR